MIEKSAQFEIQKLWYKTQMNLVMLSWKHLIHKSIEERERDIQNVCDSYRWNHYDSSIKSKIYLERARIFLRLRLSLRIRFLRHCKKNEEIKIWLIKWISKLYAYFYSSIQNRHVKIQSVWGDTVKPRCLHKKVRLGLIENIENLHF